MIFRSLSSSRYELGEEIPYTGNESVVGYFCGYQSGPPVPKMVLPEIMATMPVAIYVWLPVFTYLQLRVRYPNNFVEIVSMD